MISNESSVDFVKENQVKYETILPRLGCDIKVIFKQRTGLNSEFTIWLPNQS